MFIPEEYVQSHILAGHLARQYTGVIPIFVVYQITQLLVNHRLFLLHNHIEHGNSMQHTITKLAQFAQGYLLISEPAL